MVTLGYSTEVYDEAFEKLAKRRLYSEQELEKRRKKLFEFSPRAEQIEHQLAKTSIAAAKAVVYGADIKGELESLKVKNMALQQELNEIIDKLGFARNWLEEWHTCEKCKDTGYIDGKMCDCLKKLLKATANEQLNRISPLSLSDFESFSLEYYSKIPPRENAKSPYERMSGVLSNCKKYAENFSTDSSSLLFQGGPGLGKTHLSLAIAKSAIDKGFGVIYVSAPAILAKIENEHFGRRDTAKNNTEQLIMNCDLLILDDLGTEFATNFTVSAIYNIINTRMITSKPTIISTNLSVKELQEKYNERTVSRIIGMLRRVEFVGTDVRQLKRSQRLNAKNQQA